MAPTPSPRASYLPQTRQEAGKSQLADALAYQASLEDRLAHAALTQDEISALREHLLGAKAEVKNCKRYIAAGCPRVRETA
ncbi:hypothetical protein [Streptomyces atratus]|uniref:hypothetical protein n=1 Tax=Streptomyces atratus TaxID=1893 RepID=UPI00365BF850